MPTLRPLRSAIIGLGLFAAAASAQAQLLITFLEDTEKGHLSVIFSGQAAAPFDVPHIDASRVPYYWGSNYVVATNNNTTTTYISSAYIWEFTPWQIGYIATAPIFNAGSGGFLHNGTYLALISTTSAEAGQQMSWDGILTYEGSLADIGLEEGDSGTLVFTEVYGGRTFEIYWDTAVVVPEPATYALALGLGVAGVALLRRRARH